MKALLSYNQNQYLLRIYYTQDMKKGQVGNKDDYTSLGALYNVAQSGRIRTQE